MTEVLIKIGYTNAEPLDDECFNNLLNAMWVLISLNPEDYDEPSVSERNLIVFLQAVDNLFLESMTCTYPMCNKDYR